jgi:hypothetical protein
MLNSPIYLVLTKMLITIERITINYRVMQPKPNDKKRKRVID